MDSLLELIVSSTQTLQSELAKANLPEPSLSTVSLHQWDHSTPPTAYWDARKVLIASLGMLMATVQNPKERIMTDAILYHRPAALNFVTTTDIANLIAKLEDKPGQGVSIDILSSETKASPAKIATIMRYLCSHHIFEERKPDVFANNRISVTLRDGEPTKGFVELWTDVSLRASTQFSQACSDPVTSWSSKSDDSAFATAFGGLEYWRFLALPGNEKLVRRFAEGMTANVFMHGREGALDFPWHDFDKPGALFVEVGSGLGHLSRQIIPSLQHVSFQNQDRPEVCKEGEKVLQGSDLTPEQKARVTFVPNDFFQNQPVKGADIYILSNVLHDWEDEKALVILQKIREAMSPGSKLLIIEALVTQVLTPDINYTNGTNGSHVATAPRPLLSNYGVANSYVQHQHMEMVLLGNASDRTLEHWLRLLVDRAGFTLVGIKPLRRHVSVIELTFQG